MEKALVTTAVRGPHGLLGFARAEQSQSLRAGWGTQDGAGSQHLRAPRVG